MANNVTELIIISAVEPISSVSAVTIAVWKHEMSGLDFHHGRHFAIF